MRPSIPGWPDVQLLLPRSAVGIGGEWHIASGVIQIAFGLVIAQWGWTRQVIPFHFAQLVAFKIDTVQVPRDAAIAATLEIVVIVPAIIVKRIGQQAVAQDKADLALAHAQLELVDHVLGNNMPLLDIEFVHPREEFTACKAEDTQADQ